jgi:hypothetical protein
MTSRTSTFPSDLGISTRVGLTRGVGLPGPRMESFAQAEMRYRQQRLLDEATGRHQLRERHHRHDQQRSARAGRSRRNSRGLVTRWTTWLPSIPLHRSSAAPQSSSACGN